MRHSATNPRGRLVGTSTVALLLNVSHATAGRLLRSGRIPSLMIGRRWRCYRTDAMAFCEAQQAKKGGDR